MRVLFAVLIAITFAGFSCKKKEDPGLTFNEQLSLDSAAIANYLQDNNITDLLTDSRTGYVNYVLHDSLEGHQVVPLTTDSVEVSYAGRLLSNDLEFDSGEHTRFRVGGLITGWQLVLQDMQEGDSVTMYIPSGFAYGTKGTGDIPANANLIFNMKLHRVYQ